MQERNSQLQKKKKFPFGKVFIIPLLLLFVIAGFSSFQMYRQRPKARLFVQPNLVLKANESSRLPLMIDTGEDTINAGRIILKYDRNKLEVQLVTKDGSIFKYWVEEPAFSAEKGTISLAGGLPTPGFKGQGVVSNVMVKPLQPGKHKLEITVDTQFLKNDGLATPVNLKMQPLVFSVN